MIIESSGKWRVEVSFAAQREDDTLTIERTTYTVPVSGSRTMWSQGRFDSAEIFTVNRDEIPELMKALAYSLMVESGESI